MFLKFANSNLKRILQLLVLSSVTLQVSSPAFAADGNLSYMSCQQLSNQYGIFAGVTFNRAPGRVKRLWREKNCNTRPSYITCRRLSNQYGIYAGQTFGTAGRKEQNMWKAMGCNTNPGRRFR